jgi:PAS domain S-box-containing protein
MTGGEHGRIRPWVLIGRGCSSAALVFMPEAGSSPVGADFVIVGATNRGMQRKMAMTAEKISRGKKIESEKRITALAQDLDRRNTDLNILYTVTKAVHQSLDLKEVYRIALDTIISLDNVDMVFAYLVDEDRKFAILETHRNVPESYTTNVNKIPKGIGLTWKIIETGKPLNIEDIQTDKVAGPGGKKLGHHGILGIPLTAGKTVIGVIYFASYKNRRFDDSEVNLFSSISDHISLAISKAKLYEELRKKNKREKMLSSITRSVHQSIDLKHVLQNASESIMHSIDNANNVAIYMAHGIEAAFSAYAGNNDMYAKFYDVFVPEMNGATWKILNEGKPVIYNDITPDSVERIDFLEPGAYVGSYLGLPVRYKKRIIGSINIISFEKNIFDGKELEFFNVVVKQIESAIDNAGMAEALRESEKKYRELYENVPAGIYRKSEDGRILMANPTLLQMLGYDSFEELASKNLKRSEFVMGREGGTLSLLQKGSQLRELESSWYKKDGSIVNVIESVRAISDKNGNFLYYEGTVTDITERKKAEMKLEESREHLRRLTAHLQHYREEERAIVAREIHDEFAQLLTGIAIDISWLKRRIPAIVDQPGAEAVLDKIEKLSVLIDNAFQSVKKICAKLRPKILDDLGIDAAVMWQIDAVRAQTDINFEFKSFVGDFMPDPKISIAIFRIFQEALTNILRHAEAKNVVVTLEKNGGFIVLGVEDDGKGIAESSMFGVEAMGLLGMRERVYELNGDLRIKGAPGVGTSIKVQIPCEVKTQC